MEVLPIRTPFANDIKHTGAWEKNIPHLALRLVPWNVKMILVGGKQLRILTLSNLKQWYGCSEDAQCMQTWPWQFAFKTIPHMNNTHMQMVKWLREQFVAHYENTWWSLVVLSPPSEKCNDITGLINAWLWHLFHLQMDHQCARRFFPNLLHSFECAMTLLKQTVSKERTCNDIAIACADDKNFSPMHVGAGLSGAPMHMQNKRFCRVPNPVMVKLLDNTSWTWIFGRNTGSNHNMHN
jgi:hypothetical protein